jgi:cell wall assembly regulator SMI1
MAAYATQLEEIKSLLPIYEELLNPGVSAVEMEEFLKNIQLDIPASFVEFYHDCNGGQDYESVDIEGITFSSLESVLRTKNMFDGIMKEKKQADEFFYWHSDWLPFADDYSYDTLCIDTTGKGTGMKGCVLIRSKDLFEGDEMSIIAHDYDSFIRGWFERVKDGQVYSLTEKDVDGKNRWLPDNGCYYKRITQVPLRQ